MFNCPKGYCARGSKNRCSSHVCPCLSVRVTLKTTFLRRGNGGGTCLRLPVFCRKVSKLTPLDPVLEHLFVVSAGSWEHPWSKRGSKNGALDPVSEHIFVVSAGSWEHSWSKRDRKMVHWTLFWNYYLSVARRATLPCGCILVILGIQNTIAYAN